MLTPMPPPRTMMTSCQTDPGEVGSMAVSVALLQLDSELISMAPVAIKGYTEDHRPG